MNLLMLLDEGTSGRVCLTLLHSLWQVALLAAVMWVIDRLWCKSSVERSYTLHVAALLLALAALPITYALLPAPIALPTEVATSMAEPALPTAIDPAPVADKNVEAHQQAYEVGTITLDAVLEANRKRAEAKVALSRAQKKTPQEERPAEQKPD